LISEPVKIGDPEQVLEKLSLDLRMVQERENCMEWDDFQRRMPEWRKW
jgi:hypothetical protein